MKLYVNLTCKIIFLVFCFVVVWYLLDGKHLVSNKNLCFVICQKIRFEIKKIAFSMPIGKHLVSSYERFMLLKVLIDAS